MVALYFYLRNFKVVDDLIHYMPQETELYIEFDLKDKDLLNFYENNFRGKSRFEKLMRDSNFFQDLSKDLIEQANKISLLVINHNNESHNVWLLAGDNIHKFHALLPTGYFESMLDSKTTALTKNRDVLKMIRQIEPMTEHTSEQRKILNKFSDDNFMNIYMSGSHAEFLSTRPDPIYTLILNNLDLDYSKPSFLGLSTNENKVIYNFYGETNKEKDYKNFGGNVETPRWGVSATDTFLQFHSPNLKNICQEVISIWSDDKKSEWSQKYEFEWKELEKILDNSGIIFMNSKSGPVDTDEILNLKKYNYALLINTDSSNDVEKIKNVIKNILAFKYPSEIVKRLADGTQSTELVADSSKFEFSAKCAASDKECRDAPVGRLIEFIQEQDFRFVIANSENYLIVGNSLNLIEDILNTNQDKKETACGIFTGNELAIINSKNLISGLLSYIDKAIINIEYNKKEIELKGCFIW